MPNQPTSPATPVAIALYTCSTVPALPVVAWPIPGDQWAQFLDTEELVTFTIRIPLERLVNGDIDALNEYAEQAFEGKALLLNSEFRAVGEAVDNEDFSDRFVGDITLQVTASLYGAY